METTTSIMNALKLSLNPIQYTAATCPGNVLQILAGPGCGKTKTLTSRICYLLSRGVDAKNIIVTTFTKKAAKEMNSRLQVMLEGGKANALILGTFHSICRRYLIKYGKLIGLPSGWTIADTSDSIAMYKEIISTMPNLSLTPNECLSKISWAKSKMRGDFELLQFKDIVAMVGPEMAKIYAIYTERLKRMDTLDFDDILLCCAKLLQQHPGCVSNIEHVLVDEFQDTNAVQYEIMKSFCKFRKCATVVGDPDQGIYGWRSADVTNIKKLREDFPDLEQVNLIENYRSSESIIKCSTVIIQQDSTRLPKHLHGNKHEGHSPVIRLLGDNFEEARWVAKECKRIIASTGRSISPKDIAILVRTAPLTRTIEHGLNQAGIKYRMVGGRKFFEREEVRDMLAYLRIIASTRDANAIIRVINIPPRRIGKEKVTTLIQDSETNKRTLWQTIEAAIRGEVKFNRKDTNFEKGLNDFVRTIEGALRFMGEPVDEGQYFIPKLIEHLVEKLDLAKYLEKKQETESIDRLGNIRELIAYAVEVSGKAKEDQSLPFVEGIGDEDGLDLVSVDDKNDEQLTAFLHDIALAGEVETSDEKQDTSDYLTISTIHAAKGLEWPVVFIPGVYDGSIPHFRSKDHAEERRILYVAMTRAQALLYMSMPRTRQSYDGNKRLALSPFLASPSVEALVHNRGPKYDIPALMSILNRPIPSQEVVAKECALLQFLHDDDDEDQYKNSSTRFAAGNTSSYGSSRSAVTGTPSIANSAEMPIKPFSTAGTVLNSLNKRSYMAMQNQQAAAPSTITPNTSQQPRAGFITASALMSSESTSFTQRSTSIRGRRRGRGQGRAPHRLT